jgi:DNA-directed RNA polymerase specialized sigma24 family protein
VSAESATLSEPDLEAAAERHRRELHVHCYRMLASYDDARGRRPWRSRATFDGLYVRAWPYRIATNVCIDLIQARKRHVPELTSYAEVGWLSPYPDRLLDQIPSEEDEPDCRGRRAGDDRAGDRRAPEGLLALPDRGLFLTSNEDEGSVSIFRLDGHDR